MHTPHIRVRGLMIAVAIMAIDFTAVRALFSYEPIFGIALMSLINSALMAIALHFGLLRISRTRGRARAFWVGFLICGAMAMTAFAWAALTPPGWGPSAAGAANKIRHESTMWVLWSSYFILVSDCLRSLRFDIRSIQSPSLDRPGIGFMTIEAVITFLPQLAIAWVGGMVARMHFTRVSARPLRSAKAER